MSKCIVCGVEFVPVRRTQLYCGLPCQLKGCQCNHCQANRQHDSRYILNHDPYKPASELASNELNRVSLPGDADYV